MKRSKMLFLVLLLSLFVFLPQWLSAKSGDLIGGAATSNGGCGLDKTSSNSFTVGGTLNGLNGTVVLQNNSGDNLTLTNNGPFAFPTPLLDGSTYSVTVLTQPAHQTCTVTNGSGTINGADVTNVVVTCSANTYTVGGTLNGLGSGKTVVLQNNLGDTLSLSSDGDFTFPTPLADGSTYSVTVLTQPAPQTCTIANASGTISGTNVTNVIVTCALNTYTVGGTLTGLAGGKTVVLQNNGGDNLTLSSNGAFTFSAAIANGSPYSVTIFTQPSGQTCLVTNGSGTISGANVTNVAVNCTLNNYTVGGNLSGLASGKTVVLQNNGGDNLSLSSNGVFTFSTPLSEGSTYSVTVLTQPSGQTCVVGNGSGTINAANVTNVTVTCSLNSYTVGGTLSGLGVAQTVVLQNNGTDNLSLTSNGAFTFSTALLEGSSYSVTVLTQPSDAICIVSNGTGTISGANVTNVSVVCAPMLAVGTLGGLSLSTNGGMSFVNRTTADGLGSNFISSVFISSDGSAIYAGTSGGGLSISTNGGVSFITRTTANGLGSNTVFSVFASGGVIYVGTNNGLAISTDGGVSFVNRTTADGLGGSRVAGIFVSGGIIYASTVVGVGGLSISTNGGLSFTNNSLGGFSSSGVFVNASIIYASASDGLWISTNGGIGYSQRTTANGLGGNTATSVSGNGTILAVGTNTNGPATGGLSLSTDGGANFVNRTTADGLGSNTVDAVFVDSNDGTVYGGTSGGISISTNGGVSFVNRTTANGLGNVNVRGVYAYPP